jgi:transcriptional regulator with XRE-family HTH domain
MLLCRQLSSSQFARIFSVDEPYKQGLLVLGQAIRELRVQHHRSIPDLAAICGVSPRRLAELERGRLDPDLELLAALAQGIGVRLSEIFVRAEQLTAEESSRPPGAAR